MLAIYSDTSRSAAADCRAWPKRALYRYEMLDEVRHVELLDILKSIPALVMISGYASALYDASLRGWHRIEYQAMTRGGLTTEVVWMNYPKPTVLHDYRWLGRDFRERSRINRKIARWTRRLRALPVLERNAVSEALDSLRVLSRRVEECPASAAIATPGESVCHPSTGKPWLGDSLESP
jgi:hypothetical protein